MRILSRKEQLEILDKLCEIDSYVGRFRTDEDRDERKKYLKAFDAIATIGDIVTGLNMKMYSEWCMKILCRKERNNASESSTMDMGSDGKDAIQSAEKTHAEL